MFPCHSIQISTAYSFFLFVWLLSSHTFCFSSSAHGVAVRYMLQHAHTRTRALTWASSPSFFSTDIASSNNKDQLHLLHWHSSYLRTCPDRMVRLVLWSIPSQGRRHIAHAMDFHARSTKTETQRYMCSATTIFIQQFNSVVDRILRNCYSYGLWRSTNYAVFELQPHHSNCLQHDTGSAWNEVSTLSRHIHKYRRTHETKFTPVAMLCSDSVIFILSHMELGSHHRRYTNTVTCEAINTSLRP